MSSFPLIGITAHSSQQPNLPLYGVRPAYAQSVLMAGGAPLIVPPNLGQTSARAVFDRLDAVLLSGGFDVDPRLYGKASREYTQNVNPERDRLETWLVRWACAEQKPLLAICRGVQILNVVLGGSLYQDVLIEKPQAIRHAYYDPQENWPRDHRPHNVQVTPNSLLAKVLGLSEGGSLPVNSLHHQGIKTVADDLAPSAYAPDGLIEALELPKHRFALGVQWHPEELALNDSLVLRLFQALIEASKKTR